MPDEKLEIPETPTNPDEVQDSTPESNDDTSEDDVKKEEEVAGNYERRLKKAKQRQEELKKEAEAIERENKAASKPNTPTEDDAPKTSNVGVRDLPLQDINALSGMHEDDANSLIDYAEFKKIPVHEAKASKEWKAIQGVHTEERASAEAAETASGTRKSTNRTSDEQLIKQADEGTLPEDKMRAAAQAKVRQLREKSSN